MYDQYSLPMMWNVEVVISNLDVAGYEPMTIGSLVEDYTKIDGVEEMEELPENDLHYSII